MVRRRRKREKHVGTGALIGALLPIVAGGTGLVRSGFQPIPPTVIVQQAPAPAAAAPAAAAPAGTSQPAPAEPAAAPRGNASAECLARYGSLLPSNAADAKERETLVCRRGYVLAFDADTRDPDWVMERLTKADLDGSAKRSNAFKPDPVLNGADASNRDYAKQGYDRGHQAPAGDARFSQQVMNESFYFSNMAPQIGNGFNRGAWKFLEENVRAWVSCGGHSDLYVFTGPIYQGHAKTIGPDKVVVPAYFYKIVYDAQAGRAVGFILPNEKIGSTIDLAKYARPIAEIETETGLTFFSHLDQRSQTVLKASAGVPWGHTQTCPSDGGD
jgi:endonuclease G